MELRGVDEEKIDSILLEYEEELSAYSSVLDTEDVATSALPNELDDSDELRELEAEILGKEAESETPNAPARDRTATTRTPVEGTTALEPADEPAPPAVERPSPARRTGEADQ